MAIFVPLAVLVTLTYGLVYIETQQALRAGGNDPQFQLAEDAASRLDAGDSAATVAGNAATIDVATSLSPFMIISDAKDSVIASNAILDGSVPLPPHGVLDAARTGSANAVTWEPRDGVRIASVTVSWSGGTVLVGRSLRRVEQQEWNAELIAGAAWLTSLLALVVAALLAAVIWPFQPSHGRRWRNS